MKKREIEKENMEIEIEKKLCMDAKVNQTCTIQDKESSKATDPSL